MRSGGRQRGGRAGRDFKMKILNSFYRKVIGSTPVGSTGIFLLIRVMVMVWHLYSAFPYAVMRFTTLCGGL